MTKKLKINPVKSDAARIGVLNILVDTIADVLGLKTTRLNSADIIFRVVEPVDVGGA
jgi:hypothetical protein